MKEVHKMKYDKVYYQVDYIETEYGEGSPWAVSYSRTVDGQTVTSILITDGEVYDYFTQKYHDWTCSHMWEKFLMYNSMHAEELEKAQFAYYNSTYNPINDYSETREKTSIKDDGDEERTHTTGGDGGTHNKVTNEALDGTYTQHDTTTYDNATFRGETKDTQHGGTRTTDDLHTLDKIHHTTISKTIDGETVSGYEIAQENEKVSGYKTAPQDSIEKEIALRLKPLNCIYLDNFMKEYAYYISGAWGGINDY